MRQLLHVNGVISLTNSCLPPLGGPSLSTVRKLALAPKPPLHHRDHEHAHLLSNIEKLPVPIWDRSIPASSAESVPFFSSGIKPEIGSSGGTHRDVGTAFSFAR